MARKTAFDDIFEKEIDPVDGSFNTAAWEEYENWQRKRLDEALSSGAINKEQYDKQDYNDFQANRITRMSDTDAMLNAYRPVSDPFEGLNKQNSSQLAMNRYLKKVAASAEEDFFNEFEGDPKKLKLSRDQASRFINTLEGELDYFGNPVMEGATPENVISDFDNEKTWENKTRLSGMNSQEAIKGLYDAYNKGGIGIDKFNKIRDMLNIQEELEAQGRRIGMDEFAKIPSSALEQGRRLSPEERAEFNLYNKELLPGYDKAYAPANFKKQNSSQLAMNRYLKKIAASAEEDFFNEFEGDPKKLKLSRDQASRFINTLEGELDYFGNPVMEGATPENVISDFDNEKTWENKTRLSGMNSQEAIKGLYDAYNKGGIGIDKFNKIRDMLNIQEELEAQGRRIGMDEFAKIPSSALEQGRRLSPEERAEFNLYNKELLPGYNKAYAPANFKKQNSSQLAMNRYLKKVAATAVVIERKTATPDPRKRLS